MPSLTHGNEEATAVVVAGIRECIVKGMVFPVVMYGCESRSIKKAEC